jgi:Xaa-Pro aminopeptidase
MKKDIPHLLAGREIDILWVTGATHDCPEVYYLADGAAFTRAWILLRPGSQPLLCHGPMERESAALSGCRTLDFISLGQEAVSRSVSDPILVQVETFARLAERESLSGRMAVHGVMDPGEARFLIEEIERRLPQIEVVRDTPSLLDEARATKDPQEIEDLKAVARDSLEALKAALDLLRGSHIEDGRLTGPDRAPVTVGAVRAVLSARLAALGLTETHETILSIGREAGIPHASSLPDTVFTAGRTVVIDLFPCRKGGGYYFDITRSFVIGSAPEEALQLYEDVLSAQRKAVSAVRPGMDGRELQELVCGHFESLGHPTVRQDPSTTRGYVHSLGHGVGLQVHEYPYLRLQDVPDPRNRLLPGSVFTIEPGLYYPEQGMGIRIEDLFYLDPDGAVCELAPFEKFPVLEPQG